MPGKYIVRLKVGGRIYEHMLQIKMDPRVKTPEAGLQEQFDLSIQAYNGINQTRDVLDHIQKYRTQIKELQARTGQGPISSDLGALDLHAFGLFLSLLGEALTDQVGPEATAERQTGDGLLHISLTPLAADSHARIDTPHGVFSGRDHLITITPTRGSR